MSRRSRKSNQAEVDQALKIGAGVVKQLGFKTTAIILGALLVVAAVGVAFYFLFLQPQPEPAVTDTTDQDEAISSDVGREQPTPIPGVVAPELGSGGTARSDWYELHFTKPSYPDNKANHKGSLDANLVDLMNKATRTLDVADYDFDLANVAQAMAAAKSRGVVVRMVTDSDTLNNTKNAEVQSAFATLKKAGIPIVDDQRKPIMHNKFTVVDKQWVETGSWNYTDGDTYRLNNNMIIIRNPQLAENYSAEFEKMFVKKQFGATKDKAVPNPVVNIGGVRVQNYFAAEGGVANHIIETIQGARQSVYFLAFSFTHEGIGNAIIDKAKAGLKVGGVFETTGSNTKYSEYGKMKAANMDVYTDGNPYVMHHKVIIIDERTVIFGSFNFSDNADKDNDENLLIVDDPNMAKAFKQEYDRVLEVAKNPPVKKK
jgi:phosphatidylserine/phosphatidylglycerophosphate/cardiolipin synthase-like enzyme